jgi:hypothetical protein
MPSVKTILDNIAIEVDEPAEIAKCLKTKALQPVAVVYAKNVSDILGLLALPHYTLTIGLLEMLRNQFFVEAVAEMKIMLKSENDVAKVKERAEQLLNQARNNENSPKNPHKIANQIIGDLLKRTEVADATRALLFAGITTGWAAFESAAKDIWIVALNSSPNVLGQPAIAKLPIEKESDGLSAKQISVGLLARNGFDLRNKLGFLLADKFDFTGVSGIRTAYLSAFGKIAPFDTIFDEQNLATLEATRHLIVHRAGFVDEEYKRRTKDSTSIGSQIHLDGERVCDLVNSSIAVHCKLIKHVDDWLIKNQ